MRNIVVIGILISFRIIQTETQDGVSGQLNVSHRQPRWSYFTRFVEHICANKCRKLGNKPFGHLVGTRCECLCPVNASEWDPCNAEGTAVPCFEFCQTIGYFEGGLCLNLNCLCKCKIFQYYNASIVYTTPATDR